MTQGELETTLLLLGWKVKTNRIKVSTKEEVVCWIKDGQQIWPSLLEYWNPRNKFKAFVSVRSLYNFVITEVTNGSKGI